MKIIKDLSEMIDGTLDRADEYIDCAIEMKNDYPDIGKTLYNISDNEMSQMMSLHSLVINIISDYRRSNGEPPAPMMAVYEYLHKKQIDKAASIKAKQALYKES